MGLVGSVGEDKFIPEVGGEETFGQKNEEIWKCIGCIILAVTYGNKGYKILVMSTENTLLRLQAKYTEIFAGIHIY